MAFPKQHLFSIDEQCMSHCGRAMGYPARIAILRLLKQKGMLQHADLMKLLPLSEGAITEHLRKLRVIGLISVEEKGLENLYFLNDDGVRAVFAMQRALYEELTTPVVEGGRGRDEEVILWARK